MTEVFIITGTDTGVGKTIATAAIAACATAQGLATAVLKPAQTGTTGLGESDVDVVCRLAGPDHASELSRYPDALSPRAAARVSGRPELAIGDVIGAVDAVRPGHRVVLLEGAGGLLVPMGQRGWTLADLAVALRAPVIVVTRAGLGTLNHTALTLEALAARGVPAWVLLGAWPARPELVHWNNLTDLPGELVGMLPDGAGSLAPEQFRRQAPGWLAPPLYGNADPDRLRAGTSLVAALS